MPTPISQDELHGLLRRAASVPGGVAATALRRALPTPYRPPERDWPGVLREAERAGVLHRWPVGRGGRWSDRPFDAWLRERTLEALARGPVREPELKAALPSSGRSRLPKLLPAWAGEGVVFAHPKRGRSRVWGSQPADRLDYVARPAVEELVEAMVARGFDEREVRLTIARQAGGTEPAPAAARQGEPRPDPGVSGDPAALLLARLVELNPQARGGALVYLPHLRTATRDAFGDKGAFDRAVLALAEQRRVQLQSHPVPSQLRPEERDSMIEDGRGSFYMAIGLHQP